MLKPDRYFCFACLRYNNSNIFCEHFVEGGKKMQENNIDSGDNGGESVSQRESVATFAITCPLLGALCIKGSDRAN